MKVKFVINNNWVPLYFFTLLLLPVYCLSMEETEINHTRQSSSFVNALNEWSIIDFNQNMNSIYFERTALPHLKVFFDLIIGNKPNVQIVNYETFEQDDHIALSLITSRIAKRILLTAQDALSQQAKITERNKFSDLITEILGKINSQYNVNALQKANIDQLVGLNLLIIAYMKRDIRKYVRDEDFIGIDFLSIQQNIFKMIGLTVIPNEENLNSFVNLVP